MLKSAAYRGMTGSVFTCCACRTASAMAALARSKTRERTAGKSGSFNSTSALQKPGLVATDAETGIAFETQSATSPSTGALHKTPRGSRRG